MTEITISDVQTQLKELNDAIKTNSVGYTETQKQVADMSAKLASVETKLNTPKLAVSTADVKAETQKALNAFLRSKTPVQETKLITGLTVGDSTTPGEGYSLTAPEFYNEVMAYVTAFSPIRQYANVVKMGAGDKIIPIRDGITTAAWTDETTARTEATGLSTTSATLHAFEATADVYVSQTQIEDSLFPVDSFIAQELGESFGKLEGAAFIGGNGTGAPKGITSVTAAVTADSDTAITVDELMDLEATLDPYYRQGAVWLMNSATVASFRKAKVVANGEYALQRDLSNPLAKTLFGYPILECPDMPTVAASAKAVVLANLKQGYMIADRVEMDILRDPYTSRPFTVFAGRKRVAGTVVRAEAIKVLALDAGA